MRLTLLFFFLVLPSITLGKKHYITGPQKITFRDKPETSAKIIEMVETETPMELLEEMDNGWSKVQSEEGKEGYVLTRFLTDQTPYSLRFRYLDSKYKKLQEKHNQLKENLAKTTNEFNAVKKELASTHSELSGSKKAYQELKEGSTQYVQLKEKFDNTTEKLQNKETELKVLESQLSKTYIIWFIAGAGVLLVGWLIGLTTRKKKGYGSQIIID